MKEARIIQVPATLDSVNRKKDRSVKFAFTTMREITTDEFMIMDTYHQAEGWLLFRENQFVESDIPQEDVETDVAKSQSTQIRDALWILYRAMGNSSGDKQAWERFYKEKQQAFKARILDEVHRIEDK